MDEIVINKEVTEKIKGITPFIDYNTISRIFNKLTDYAEVITEGKLSGIINFNYSLNSTQTNLIIELLLEIQALSRIYIIAQKGKRDLEGEFISNIFSDPGNPGGISSYISLRTLLENRLNHQVQQYNMNMNKSNTTMSIPINELHGHVKTYKDLSSGNITISHKAQHGYVAASLHDAYLTIMNRTDWWDDRTYMKYFFNEDDHTRRNLNLITRADRLSLFLINSNVKEVLNYFQDIAAAKVRARQVEAEEALEAKAVENIRNDESSIKFSDRLLMTPFGRQYGARIDTIITEIFKSERITAMDRDEEGVKNLVDSLFQVYRALPGSLSMNQNTEKCITLVYYLLGMDFGIKKFTEIFLYNDKKIPFSRFFPEVKDDVDEFLTRVFIVFFEQTFSTIFRIVKSLDMKQYACAFIIKRIYLIKGEELPTFGYFLIKAIARYGKIKVF
ncbi:MAG TPA: hypothetical protein PK358_15205 [Spirochaetota bacterium]|nr:hypothetical protein [Spirochaetota bacterium]HPJ36187.1 hypothetical protein [Spirochaetota bacterium]